MILAYTAVLVLYGNGASLLVGSALPAGGWLGASLGMLLAASALFFARLQGLRDTELGLARERALASAAIGLGLALAVVGPALLFLRFPPLLGQPVSYAPLAALSSGDLVLRVALFMPLDTVIPEEVAFRGVLLALLRRRRALPAAVALSAAVFAAWHVVIVQATLAQTNLVTDPLFASLGYVGAFAAVFAGGFAFAALRVVTGSLGAPLAAHWAFNSALLVGLSLTR